MTVEQTRVKPNYDEFLQTSFQDSIDWMMLKEGGVIRSFISKDHAATI